MKKPNVILFIDTSKTNEISVAVEIAGKRFEKKSASKSSNAQMVLPLFENLVKEQKLTLTDICEIKVHTGPGSFTGLRVGIAIANMLGTMLRIPINGNSIGSCAFPHYSPSKLD